MAVSPNTNRERVLLLAPTARDGRISVALLAKAGIDCAVCADITALCAGIAEGAGAAILYEESMDPAAAALLTTTLMRQPVWSDIPVIMLVSQSSAAPAVHRISAKLGNCVTLERPVHVATLISLVQTALRTRRRQYQVQMLNESGEILATSLDEPAMLDRVVTLLVPQIADACTIYLTDGNMLAPRAQAFANPDYQALADTLRAISQIDRLSAPLWQIISSGKPDLRPTIDQTMIAALVEDPAQRAILQRIGARSHVLLPLIAHGQPIGVLALAMIDSGRQFGEANLPFLQELTERLAPTIDNLRLYAAERRARAEAERAIGARDELIALVSHDLKNPLTTLLGQAQLLKRRLGAQPNAPASTLRSVDAIEEAAQRMRAQIATLLDGMKLQSGAELDIQRAPSDVGEIVRAAVDRFAQTSQHHQLSFEPPRVPLTAELDVARMERVLDNLLANALKYSPDGGAIQVQLSRALRQGRIYAAIQVRDSGVGIPADELTQIFQPFHRATNVRGTFQGTGLGLASVRQIIEAHDGWVDVRSEQGSGATFTVAVPVIVAQLTEG